QTDDTSLDKVYHQTVKKVTEDYENYHFNTGISQLMVFVNEAYKVDHIPKDYIEGFIKLLSPITPHIAEEIWERLGHEDTISYEKWPRSEEHTSELQSRFDLVCRLLLEKKNKQ